jgi:hypothetical protein
MEPFVQPEPPCGTHRAANAFLFDEQQLAGLPRRRQRGVEAFSGTVRLPDYFLMQPVDFVCRRRTGGRIHGLSPVTRRKLAASLWTCWRVRPVSSPMRASVSPSIRSGRTQ